MSRVFVIVRRYIANDRQARGVPARRGSSRGGPDPAYGSPVPPPEQFRSRYPADVLATDWRGQKRGRPAARAVEAEAQKGLVVEEVTTDWCGEIVAVERDLMTLTLEDRHGRRRTFPLGPGFL